MDVEVRGQPIALFLSFHHLGPGDQTHNVRFNSMCLYLLSHIPDFSPKSFLKIIFTY